MSDEAMLMRCAMEYKQTGLNPTPIGIRKMFPYLQLFYIGKLINYLETGVLDLVLPKNEIGVKKKKKEITKDSSLAYYNHRLGKYVLPKRAQDDYMKGVYFDSKNQRWRAYGDCREYLGSFLIKETAIKARIRWEKQGKQS